MEHVLVAREFVVKFFKRFEVFILPVLKFFLGLFVFSGIFSIGYMHDAIPPITEALEPTLVNWLFALLFTIMPMNLSWIIIIVIITLQFSVSLELAIAVFLFLMFVFLFYARMAPKESILIIFTIIAFQFNVPYLIPIIVGLYFPVTAVVPVTVGIFINSQIPVLFGLMPNVAAVPAGAVAEVDERDFADMLADLPEAFGEVYEMLMSSLGATQTWLFTALIFAFVAILVHIVSRQAIDFSKEIAIVLGCVMTIFGFIVVVLTSGEQVDIGMMIIGTLVCGLLAGIVRFFDGILDYQRAESVQFEDENNYYHVRIVPKVKMTKSQRVVKRIRPQPEAHDTTSEDPRDEEL